MRKLKDYGELIKFQHTIFAIPFGLASIAVLAKEVPPSERILWIVVALILARTAGMAFNRLIDLPYDALNPRTKNWVHASGRVSKKEIITIALLSSALFVVSCYFINILALLLSPAVVALLILYPYGKRFTHFPHFILGAVYLVIPLGVDVALNESISPEAITLGVAMATWVSGFDILYALQDVEFDKRQGLKSLPVLLGVKGSLRTARILHLITLTSLILLGIQSDRLSYIYFIGLVPISTFLMYEHSIVKEDDLSRLNKAFFTVNGYISVAFLLVVLADVIL